jgi:beta-lactamase regulating signal transducer with metallopeptidase domain
MASTPVFPPPVNPDDPGRGPMVIGITWTFSGLAVITTILRLYVRKRIGKYWSADDWLMLGAMVSLIPHPMCSSSVKQHQAT